ncbi:MAG TPA: Shedu anti-phage system protein SduA domain-containing protein [Candidatus Dormibacteraeota bacterium]|nr:Shedu anti-phage system protein SduA domain-containing protein [Candidatus Dormibacteraeota bacterium]
MIAHKTKILLKGEVEKFEQLLSRQKISESELQRFLEEHPQILQTLGYSHIYPHVVLERSDNRNLIPDFILEPVHDEWCDILDLKLPTMKTVVGGADRKTLSSGAHELVAQLREYATFFEDPRHARRVEELYGIKCYKPKLVGVIGRDPRLADERQLRRLMTSYADAKILTFDQLLRVAKSRLLI